MQILIIRFSSLGDVVLTSGFCAWFKRHYPDCKIDFVTSKGNELLLENLPCINEVISYEKNSGLKDIASLRKLAHKLKENKYQFIVDLHGNTRSFILRQFLNHIPVLVLDKWRLERKLLIKKNKNYLKQAPAQFERAMVDFANTLGLQYEREEQFKWQRAQGLKNITTTPASFINVKNKDKILAICPGASFATKKYPINYFVDIATEVLNENKEAKIIILGGPAEDECSQLADALDQYKNRVENYQGKLSLKESIEIVAKTKVVLGNDSLYGHIADSAHIAALSIFGPTDERFGFAPYGVSSKTYSVRNLDCRPCSLIGNKKCYRTNQFCMDNINRQEIIRDILKRLND